MKQFQIMVNTESKREKETEDIIDTLIELSAKNLEKRIKEFEADIEMRRLMLDTALSQLDDHQLKISEDIQKVGYTSSLEFTLNKRIALKQDSIRTHMNKINECISYFKDVSLLKDKLRSAQEELALEKEKIKLIKS